MIRVGEIWSDARCERLKSLWDKGLSASAIAVEFGDGVTRNAICGKIMRMKLPQRGIYRGPKTTNEKKPPKATPKPKLSTFHSVPKLDTIEQVKLRCVEIEPRLIALLDLEPNDCRYPYGEGSSIAFCGHPQIRDSSYCPAHRGLTQYRSQNISEAEHERRRRHFIGLLKKNSVLARGVPAA